MDILSTTPVSAATLMQLEVDSEGDLIAALRQGLPVETFHTLQRRLNLPTTLLAEALAIPPRTLTRRVEGGRFTPQESERLLRLARVVDKAEQLFGEPEDVRAYLTRPVRGLGGQTPLQMLDTELGTRQVEDLIMRLVHGVVT